MGAEDLADWFLRLSLSVTLSSNRPLSCEAALLQASAKMSQWIVMVSGSCFMD